MSHIFVATKGIFIGFVTLMSACGGGGSGTDSASDVTVLTPPSLSQPSPSSPPSNSITPVPSQSLGKFDDVSIGPNTLKATDLQGAVIEVSVPAGEWRAIRFGSDLYPEDVKATVAIATNAATAAQPWVGFGSQIFDSRTKAPIFPPKHQFLGLRSGKPDAYLFGYSSASSPPGSAYPEAVFVIGSNGAPTTFYLGIIPEEAVDEATSVELNTVLTLINGSSELRPAEPEILAALQARPRIQMVNMQSGRGGFGFNYLRAYQSDGTLVQYKAGPVAVEVGSPASALAGESGLRTVTLSLEQPMSGQGALSFAFAGVSQLGGEQWRYEVDGGDFRRARVGVYGGASSYLPHVGTTTGDDITLGPMFALVSSSVSAGVATYNMSHTLAGKEGGGVSGIGSGLGATVAPNLFIALGGYANLDYGRIYGWLPGAVEFY